jgi:preprotein translocase subunit SecA
MTGTARTAAAELEDTYGVQVTVIPTNRPMIRADHPDRVFATREAKEAAVIEEIRGAHATGRPILAGGIGCQVRRAERAERRG